MLRPGVACNLTECCVTWLGVTVCYVTENSETSRSVVHSHWRIVLRQAVPCYVTECCVTSWGVDLVLRYVLPQQYTHPIYVGKVHCRSSLLSSTGTLLISVSKPEQWVLSCKELRGRLKKGSFFSEKLEWTTGLCFALIVMRWQQRHPVSAPGSLPNGVTKWRIKKLHPDGSRPCPCRNEVTTAPPNERVRNFALQLYASSRRPLESELLHDIRENVQRCIVMWEACWPLLSIDYHR